MMNYRKNLEMHAQGYSQKSIEASIRSSHQTVKAALDLVQELNIPRLIGDDVPNDMLDKLLYGSQRGNAVLMQLSSTFVEERCNAAYTALAGILLTRIHTRRQALYERTVQRQIPPLNPNYELDN